MKLITFLIGGLLAVALCGAVAQTSQRTYYVVTINALATGNVKHTHVSTTGYVAAIYHESDGDWHIRVCDKSAGVTKDHCLITEVIPSIPIQLPKVGARVTIQGITRYDKEHGWYEIHPVEKLFRFQ